MTYKNFGYEKLNNNTIKITYCNGTDSDVVVPSEIDGYKVTSIGAYAFSGCTSLESVTIPNSVAEIGNNAFWGCESLKEIELPKDVTKIGYSAFYNCPNLENIEISKGMKFTS